MSGKIGLVAEAAIWLAGGLLVANGLGYHMKVDLSSVGLGPASPSPVRSLGPSASLETSSLPSVEPTGWTPPVNATAVQKFQSFQTSPKAQFTGTIKDHGIVADSLDNIIGALSGSGAVAFAGKDCSIIETMTGESSSGASSATGWGVVMLGSALYKSQDAVIWTKIARPTDISGTCARLDAIVAPWSWQDVGVELRMGKRAHRLEVTDSADLLAAVKGTHTEYTNVQVDLVYWIDDNGLPIRALETLSFYQTVNHLVERISDARELTFDTFSGVSVTAPTS